MPDYASETDDSLVLLTRSGDNAAFDALHKRHRAWVKRHCKSILRDETEADDATQDTFILAYGGIHARMYNPPGRFRAWLRVIATHVCIARMRRRHPYTPLDGLEEVLAAPADADPGLRDCVRRALAELLEEDRRLLLLKYEQQLSDQEIAVIEVRTVSSVSAKLFSARKRFLEALVRVCPDELEGFRRGRKGETRGAPKKARPEGVGDAGSDPREDANVINGNTGTDTDLEVDEDE